jgi:WD40 repeat protein
MRLYRMQDGADDRRAVGRVGFHPDGARLVALSGGLHRQRCYPDTAHQVGLSSGEIRTAPAGEDQWDHPTVSPDGRFTTAALHWSAGAVVVYLRRPFSREPTRGLRLADPNAGSSPWQAFAPDGTLFAALNRAGFEHADLYRVDPDEAVAAYDRPGAKKSFAFRPSPFSTKHPPILDGALQWLGRIDARLTYRTPPAFSADGRLLAAWPLSGPAVVVDASTGQVLCRPPWKGPQTQDRESYRVALSPDGSRIALVGGGVTICQRMDGSGKPWRTKQPVGYVTDAAFHPDGLSLIAVDRQGRAHRLDAATGRLMLTLDWGAGMLLCVACSPDGTASAAGGAGGNVVVWDLDD